MDERRGRFVAFVGTVLLHVAVVAWLAAAPVRAAFVLDAVDMDVVDLTPPEPEVPPEPPPPETPPEAPPERSKQPRERRPEPEEPPPEQTPPDETTDQVPDETPPVIDFGEQSFAAAGAGTGFQMTKSSGGSELGVYRPGGKGGSGPVGSTGAGAPSKAPDFAPVPGSQLARPASPVSMRPPPYPTEARRQHVEGPVRLLVEIRASGVVRNVRVLSDPGGGLADAAIAFVRSLRWRPAHDRDGRPVDSRVVYTVRYLLED